ncbi:Ulp1 family isopeptidase [Ancylobacter sp.]
MKKWVKEDLFAKDYLLFPLNLPEHWSLIVKKINL